MLSSLIYFTYYFTSYNFIVYLEYAFIFLAGAACFIILLRILNHVKKHKRYRVPLLVTSGFILVSGIIAVIYFRNLTTLLDTMRINFVNESRYVLTDIKISGCQKKQVEKRVCPHSHLDALQLATYYGDLPGFNKRSANCTCRKILHFQEPARGSYHLSSIYHYGIIHPPSGKRMRPPRYPGL